MWLSFDIIFIIFNIVIFIIIIIAVVMTTIFILTNLFTYLFIYYFYFRPDCAWALTGLSVRYPLLMVKSWTGSDGCA